MASEEEVVTEVEAMEAMYGDDCKVIRRFPPNLRIRIKPRTGGVCTEEFVEATIGFRATAKYPDEPPVITVINSKGLDDQREHDQLVSRIRERALQISSVGMLIELCEEAVEKLTEMNYPDGDCPLCLCSLYGDDEDGTPSMPFMKLMSCYHCFHSECILTWYDYLKAKELRKIIYVKRSYKLDVKGTCPICRKVFSSKDLEHVVDMAGASVRALNRLTLRAAEISGEGSQNEAISSNVLSGSSSVPSDLPLVPSGSPHVPSDLPHVPSDLPHVPSGSSDAPSGSSDAPSGSSDAPSGSSNAPSGSSNGPSGSSNARRGSSNGPSRPINTNRPSSTRRFSHAPRRHS